MVVEIKKIVGVEQKAVAAFAAAGRADMPRKRIFSVPLKRLIQPRKEL